MKTSVMPWRMLSSSVIGAKHTHYAPICQDFGIYQQANGHTLLALAEQAGHARHAQTAARLLVCKALCCLNAPMENGEPLSESHLQEACFSSLKISQGQSPNDAATLLLAVITPQQELLMAHLGTGVIMWQQQQSDYLSAEIDRGEFNSQTECLIGDSEIPQPQIRRIPDVTHVALLNGAVSCEPKPTTISLRSILQHQSLQGLSADANKTLLLAWREPF